MRDMELILAVTRKLAAPFDLMTMLAEVVDAAKQVLRAERSSIWLYDPAADELILEIATGMPPLRVPLSVVLQAPALAIAGSSMCRTATRTSASTRKWIVDPDSGRVAC
jgi:GAF domain-containing protein